MGYDRYTNVASDGMVRQIGEDFGKGDDMSKLGKRLVFLLLCLSLTLMGISLAVNATATNWKGKLAKQAATKTRLNGELQKVSQAMEVEAQELVQAKELKDSQDKSYSARINLVKVDLQKSKNALSKTHVDYQAAQKAFSDDLKIQEQTTQNLKRLQSEIAALEDQKSAFVKQNEELNDQVSQLEREVGELTRSGSLLKAK